MSLYCLFSNKLLPNQVNRPAYSPKYHQSNTGVNNESDPIEIIALSTVEQADEAHSYDKKDVDYDRKTYGGLETNDPALIAIKRSVYTDQAFTTNVNEGNFSGQLTLSFKARQNINTYATYSISYKPVGVNLGGLPTDNGRVMLELATVRPEDVNHFEFGL
mgnify:CR=1 FL=1